MEFKSTPPSSLSFPKNEAEILEFWEDTSIFEKTAFFESLERNKDKPLYSFYDGPPFASGNPHHGHVLAGTIKDVVTRYVHLGLFAI
jgi:isoleucyl-tRNA synthetase